MAKRCSGKALYLQGVKIPSGRAVYVSDGVPLRVILGREAETGEVAAKNLPDGAMLSVDVGSGKNISLRFSRETMHGQKGRRKFDPGAVSDEDRDAYLALALSGMALGARESADYSDSVLRAAVRHPGPLGAAALLERAQEVLSPSYQQYDEVEGARLLAHLSELSAQGQNVPMEWVEGHISLFVSQRAFAILSSPGTLTAPVEDALLSRALFAVRLRDPQALEDHPEHVLDGTRSEAERIRLRGDLLRYMAARPDAEEILVDGREKQTHREFFIDALARHAALSGESAAIEDLRAAATEEVDKIMAATRPPALRVVPSPPDRRPRKTRDTGRNRSSLRELETVERGLAEDLRARLAAAGTAQRTIDGIVRECEAGHEDLLQKVGVLDLHRKYMQARKRTLDSREQIWQRAERLALRDVSEPSPRAKHERPARPTLVADSLEYLCDRLPEVVCEDLLGLVLNPEAIAPEARRHVQERAKRGVEEHRTNLAYAFQAEARIARRDGTEEGSPEEMRRNRYNRPSLFDYEHGAGVSADSDFAPGSITELSEPEKAASRPAPVEGSEEAKLEANDLFVRARLVHAALAPSDDRLLSEIRLLVLAGPGKGTRARMSLNDAWTTVRNLENALYMHLALTAAWRGEFDKSETQLSYDIDNEPSLLLGERTRGILADMRKGTLRLGADPLRSSFACLSALKDATWRWGRLRRELEEVLSLPQARRSEQRRSEVEASLPAQLPEQLRKTVMGLQSSPGRRSSDQRSGSGARNAGGSRQWLQMRSCPTRDRSGALRFFGLDPNRPVSADLLTTRISEKRAFWSANPSLEGAADVLALIDLQGRVLLRQIRE